MGAIVLNLVCGMLCEVATKLVAVKVMLFGQLPERKIKLFSDPDPSNKSHQHRCLLSQSTF